VKKNEIVCLKIDVFDKILIKKQLICIIFTKVKIHSKKKISDYSGFAVCSITVYYASSPNDFPLLGQHL
jgi:hypothetical protein